MPVIKPQGGTTAPISCVFVDCETRPDPATSVPGNQDQVLWFGFAVAGRIEGGTLTRRKQIRFRTQQQFWDWLGLIRRPGQPVWLFAHNLNFDLTVLGFWSQMEQGTWKLTREKPLSAAACRKLGLPVGSTQSEAGLILTEDPPGAVLCWHSSGWRLNCVDSLNYFPGSLAKLGESLGMPKLPMPGQDEPQEIWDEYCLRDVQILETAIVQLATWWKEQELGPWPLTIASAALTAFRERWLPLEIETPESEEQKRTERAACYGGRTEALWVGKTGPAFPQPAGRATVQTTFDDQVPKGPFYCVDSSSYYGWIQSNTAVPWRTKSWWIEGRDGELACPELGPNCIASVELDSGDQLFPVRMGKRVGFARGRFTATLAGEELARAVRTGSIARTFEVIEYETAPVLSWFAQGVWEQVQRAERDQLGAVRIACKAMLARLSGKFAQRPWNWQNRPEIQADRPWGQWGTVTARTGQVRHYRSIGWLVQERIPGVDSDHVFPAIFAFITAAGREQLLFWQSVAGDRNVLYLATDGLIVTQEGLERLEDAGEFRPGQLGSLRVDRTDDSIWIEGPGTYRCGSKIVAMGRDVHGREVAPGIWVADRFQSMLATFARERKDAVAVTETTMAIPRRTVIGQVSPAGWVQPVSFGP